MTQPQLAVLFGDNDPKARRIADRLCYEYSHCALLVDTGRVVQYEYSTKGVRAVTDADKQEHWHRKVVFLNPNLFNVESVLDRIVRYQQEVGAPTLSEMLAVARERGHKHCARFVAEVLGLGALSSITYPDRLDSTLRLHGVLRVESSDRMLPQPAVGYHWRCHPSRVPSEREDGTVWATVQGVATLKDGTKYLLVVLPNGVVMPLVHYTKSGDSNAAALDLVRVKWVPPLSVETDKLYKRVEVKMTYKPYKAETDNGV